MSVAQLLASGQPTAFSFEVLPPVKGHSIDPVLATVEQLLPFGPAYINITTHRSDITYRETEPGVYRRIDECHRPGTVAIAATLRAKYGVPIVPHLICSGFSQQETEAQLIDLSFLGIYDLLLLRGDKARDDRRFTPTPGGWGHASELCRQVEQFNAGRLADGEPHDLLAEGRRFTYGVAGYPEKHEEAMNPETDLAALRAKVDEGASYVVTQMFFDNARYFDFVRRARAAGITVPIIPGLKPLSALSQRTMLPRTFRVDFPEPLAAELQRCQTSDDVRQVGIEWGIAQARELKAAGVPSIHFYSMNAAAQVAAIARAVY